MTRSRHLMPDDLDARSARGGRASTDLAVLVREVREKAIAVSDGTTEEWQDPRTGEISERERWIWLPRSQVTLRDGRLEKGQTVTIAVPEWLAKQGGADLTTIEWTEHTWNPIVGCSIVSPGCTNCYAMRQAARIERMNPSLAHYAGLTKTVNGNAVWTGRLALAPKRTLLEPLRRKKPTTYFVNSMSDLFHEDVPDEWIDRVFAVMALCPQHTFQVLTKRSARMRDYIGSSLSNVRRIAIDVRRELLGLPRPGAAAAWPLPNVWLGVSCEDQRRAVERIPDLLATPAAVRFVSAEPLLGPIDFRRWTHGWHPTNYVEARRDDSRLGTIDWIIVGGESGEGARPMYSEWVRSIVQQCGEASVSVFVKQLGANFRDGAPEGWVHGDLRHGKGGDMAEWPPNLRVRMMPDTAPPATVTPQASRGEQQG